jgi:hypothetical protein
MNFKSVLDSFQLAETKPQSKIAKADKQEELMAWVMLQQEILLNNRIVSSKVN